MTFDLYYTGLTTEPTAASCTVDNKVNLAAILAQESVAVVGNGDYTTGPIAVPKAGYYAWVAHYSDDTNGNRADSPCDDANETSFVVAAEPGIVTVVPQVRRQRLVRQPDEPHDRCDALGNLDGRHRVDSASTAVRPVHIRPGQRGLHASQDRRHRRVDGTFAGNGFYASLPVLVT